jgi:hypothetical protein
MKLTWENRSTRGKTCPSATLSTTNTTCNDPGSNPSLRGGRPAANRLSHGTALCVTLQKREALRQIFYSEQVNVFIICSSSRFHTCSLDCLLVVVFEMKAKLRLLVSATLV